MSVYRINARYCKKLIQKYYLILESLDSMGDFGEVSGKANAFNYIATIREEEGVDLEITALIVEPGFDIIGFVVDLHTSIFDVKETNHARIITTDGSRIRIDVLWKKTGYRYRMENKNDTEIYDGRKVICGYSCIDYDRLMVFEDKARFEVGDKIIYEKVGAYSMTFDGAFIRYFLDVYV